jgi:hypothetical protein
VGIFLLPVAVQAHSFSSACFSVHAAGEQPQCRTSSRNVRGPPLGHSYTIPNLEIQNFTFQPLTLPKLYFWPLKVYNNCSEFGKHLEVTTVNPKQGAPSTDWIQGYAVRLLYYWKFSTCTRLSTFRMYTIM